MKGVRFILFLISLNIPTIFAAQSLICNVEKFKIPNVDISTEINQGINNASANFMLDDSYWSLSIYELEKSENIHLLKGVEDLETNQTIYKKLSENYSSRLKDDFFYINRLSETSPITLSTINGKEYVFEANFNELHLDKNKNEEIFILRVATKANKIYLIDLHINHVNQMELTIEKAKGIINDFSGTCLII